MSDELKPCPFCGSEAVTNEQFDTFLSVVCHSCGAASAYSDEVTAAKMWNARAAVTDEQFTMAVHDGRVWKPVGTCRNTGAVPDDWGFYPSPHFRCSECGASYSLTGYAYYCPNCGAKVVE